MRKKIDGRRKTREKLKAKKGKINAQGGEKSVIRSKKLAYRRKEKNNMGVVWFFDP
jgi:hypothetical protein